MLKPPLHRIAAFALIVSVMNDAAGASPRKVILTGTAQDCSDGMVDLASGIKVSAFQIRRARPIMAHLDSMNRIRFVGLGDDSAAFARLDEMYVALQTMVAKAKALTRQKSAINGSFSLTFAPVDSVLVVGYENQEDRDFYYSSKVMNGQTDTSFILDMSRGSCGF